MTKSLTASYSGGRTPALALGGWIARVRRHAVYDIKQRYPGHAKQAAAIASQCGGGVEMNRLTVVVDEHVDVTWKDHPQAGTPIGSPERTRTTLERWGWLLKE